MVFIGDESSTLTLNDITYEITGKWIDIFKVLLSYFNEHISVLEHVYNISIKLSNIRISDGHELHDIDYVGGIMTEGIDSFHSTIVYHPTSSSTHNQYPLDFTTMVTFTWQSDSSTSSTINGEFRFYDGQRTHTRINF